MKRLTILFSLCVALAAMVTWLEANTENYTARFRDYAMGGAYKSFYVPSRDALGNERTFEVNSKWQQPRDVTNGTTPHQGADILAPMNTPLYPVYWGWIVAQDGRNSSGVCCINESTDAFEIIMQLDVNDNDIRDDEVYMKYDHVERVGFRTTGAFVTPSDQIATSGNENGGVGAHLHFGPLNPRSGSTGRWTGLERHYGWVGEWRSGDDLDFISFVVRETDNTVRATAYLRTAAGPSTPLPAGNVVLFHRRAGTSTWTARTMTLTAEADRWAVDLDTLGYAPGTSIQWLIRATRPNMADPHNAGFFPPEFAHPNNNPNAVANPYPFYTAVTQ